MVLASRPSTAVMCHRASDARSGLQVLSTLRSDACAHCCSDVSVYSIAQTVATKVQRCEHGCTAIEENSARPAPSRLQRKQPTCRFATS